MYILIRIEANDSRSVELVSRTKKKLEQYIKQNGYYWSKKHNRYINDKNCGSVIDYIIDKIDEIK